MQRAPNSERQGRRPPTPPHSFPHTWPYAAFPLGCKLFSRGLWATLANYHTQDGAGGHEYTRIITSRSEALGAWAWPLKSGHRQSGRTEPFTWARLVLTTHRECQNWLNHRTLVGLQEAEELLVWGRYTHWCQSVNSKQIIFLGLHWGLPQFC